MISFLLLILMCALNNLICLNLSYLSLSINPKILVTCTESQKTVQRLTESLIGGTDKEDMVITQNACEATLD